MPLLSARAPVPASNFHPDLPAARVLLLSPRPPPSCGVPPASSERRARRAQRAPAARSVPRASPAAHEHMVGPEHGERQQLVDGGAGVRGEVAEDEAAAQRPLPVGLVVLPPLLQRRIGRRLRLRLRRRRHGGQRPWGRTPPAARTRRARARTAGPGPTCGPGRGSLRATGKRRPGPAQPQHPAACPPPGPAPWRSCPAGAVAVPVPLPSLERGRTARPGRRRVTWPRVKIARDTARNSRHGGAGAARLSAPWRLLPLSGAGSEGAWPEGAWPERSRPERSPRHPRSERPRSAPALPADLPQALPNSRSSPRAALTGGCATRGQEPPSSPSFCFPVPARSAGPSAAGPASSTHMHTHTHTTAAALAFVFFI